MSELKITSDNPNYRPVYLNMFGDNTVMLTDKGIGPSPDPHESIVMTHDQLLLIADMVREKQRG